MNFTMMILILSTLFVLLNTSFGLWVTTSTRTEQRLMLISFDGFRPDYLHRNVTPTLNSFRKGGSFAPYMNNVFPTKTFANHFTIATGLYPGTHGVIGNSLFDSKLGYLKNDYDLFHYSKKITPIWTANELAGKRSGCLWWPGSQFPYHGVNCTFYHELIEEDLNKNVDIVVSWFTDEETPANLVMFYVRQPDYNGHKYGHESKEVTDVLAEIDNMFAYLLQRLSENGLEDQVNVVIVSDHGMTSVSPSDYIDLTKFMTNGTYEMYGSSPVLQIVRMNKLLDQILANLTKAAIENGHFKVYNHQNLPNRWHVHNPRRFGPIIVVADCGYAFHDMLRYPITKGSKYGLHGYDNADPDMHAIFFAKGPLFAQNKTLEPVNMIDLHYLFCAILTISCETDEGSNNLQSWSDLLNITQ